MKYDQKMKMLAVVGIAILFQEAVLAVSRLDQVSQSSGVIPSGYSIEQVEVSKAYAKKAETKPVIQKNNVSADRTNKNPDWERINDYIDWMLDNPITLGLDTEHLGLVARADANKDGKVDLFDLVAVARAYGEIKKDDSIKTQEGSGSIEGGKKIEGAKWNEALDINGDGRIGILDLRIIGDAIEFSSQYSEGVKYNYETDSKGNKKLRSISAKEWGTEMGPEYLPEPAKWNVKGWKRPPAEGTELPSGIKLGPIK